MRNLKQALSLAIIFCLTACSGHKPLPMKFQGQLPSIGIIADTQLQTENVHSNTTILNNKGIDKFVVGVTIRTTAQNELAALGLKALLNELTNSGAEVIFYLGDGLNNGCTDEADRFFNVLSNHQASTPVFMVIGNHDYLAAGNSRKKADRTDLCGEQKPYLNKFEVSKRINDLNRSSYSLHKGGILKDWSFINSIDKQDMICSASLQHDKEPACFYAGVLESPFTSFLLLDTSHYESAGVFGAYGDLTGAKGFVGKSQIDWLNTNASDSVKPRVLLSHYSASSFEGLVGSTKEILNLPTNISRVGDLLIPGDYWKNLWIWGHTHSGNGILSTRKITGLSYPLQIETYEVGSTTDLGNAGALIYKGENTLMADTQPICQLFDKKACQALPGNLTSSDINEPIADYSIADSLGITKAYQDSSWDLKTDQTVRRNIRYFADNRFSTHGFESTEELQLCLLRLASAMESKGNYAFKGLKNEECVQEPVQQN